MLTGNWVTSVRQLLSDIDMKTPSISDVEDLIEKHPRHKKMLQRLINSSIKHFEVEGVDEENLLQIARLLLKYKTKDLKISFKSTDNINEEDFPSCFSWDDMDIDLEQSEKIISNLPFEVKLDLYNLPEIDDANIQFHYKTDQKTDPECPYCGDDFIKHTQKCGTCGLVSGKKKEKK
jgi:predicted transcriptional regulator/ribosomal protein S27AE